MKTKQFLLCAFLAVTMASIASVASADSIELQSGATSAFVSSGTSTMINGWDVVIVFGSSYSPSLSPYGLDLVALVSCNGGTCTGSPLTISYSDTGFTAPVPAGGFKNDYSATISGSGTGSTTGMAWANSNNTLFSLGAANTIGTGVGPFSSTGAGSSTGGPAVGPGPYSLTLEDTFADASGTVAFSTDADIVATPEPSTPLLLGAGLLALFAFRRRFKRA
jgi:PEP-CTERM motif